LGLFFCFWTISAKAEPNFSVFLESGPLRAYQDRAQHCVWYLIPPPPRLKDASNRPLFSLDVFAYHGRQATGDREKFWQKVILTLNLERAWPGKARKNLKQLIKTKYHCAVKFLSLPISQAKVKLLLGDLSYEKTWRTRWRPQKIVIPLEDYLGALLWEAAQRDQVLISLVIEEKANGVRQEENKFVPATMSWVWTLPLKLDRQKYPENFRLHELGAYLSKAYTQLDILCLDFVEQTIPNLYATFVEIGFPVNGRTLIKQVRFDENTPFRQQIIFPLAHDLKRPYRYRIMRIFDDGTQKIGPWLEKQGEFALDITHYRNVNPSEEAP